jgi:ABC-type oligopeptide transport system substrate-binding subunit
MAVMFSERSIVKLTPPTKIKALILLLILSITWTTAHGQDDKEKKFAFRTSKLPNYLRLPIEGEISTIDPGISLDTASVEITEQLFLGLTEFEYVDSKYKIVPELAESWTIHENGTVYRFKMRKDVYWVGGVSGERLSPVTSKDVVRAIQRNLSPDIDSPYSSVLFILKNAKALFSRKMNDFSKLGVHAIDDYTVEFILEHPAVYFPSLLALWIYRPLPVQIIEKYGKAWTSPEYIQTNGSYLLSDWKKRRRMTLKKNPHYYHADKVCIPEIQYIILPESFTAFDMYLKDKLDIIGGSYIRLPPKELEKNLKKISLKQDYSSCPMFAIYSYQFNTLRPPVNHPLVRKAISAAINRFLLVKFITKSGQTPANTLTPPSLLGKEDNYQSGDNLFDPDQAKLWLKEAGYPEGKGFPELILMHDISDTHALIASAIKVFLKHFLNIDLTIKSMDWYAYLKQIDNSDRLKVPHIIRFGWTTDYLDANNWLNDAFYYFQSLNNWSNEEYDRIVLQASKSTNLKKRRELFLKAEKVLIAHAPILPVFFESAQYFVKPRLEGWYHMPIGGQHICNWRLK